MAKNPDDRFAGCQEFIQELWRALVVEPVTLEDTQWASANLEATQPKSINVQNTQVAPTGPPPVQPAPQPTPESRWFRRPAILLPGLLALVVLAAGGVFAGMKLSQSSETAPPAPTPAPGPAPNTGPFTGAYTAEFKPSDTFGEPDEDAAPATGKGDIRSVCRSTGCVATATATSGPMLQSRFVFDDVDGQWTAVGTASVTAPPPNVSGFKGCHFPAEYWSVITLRPRADGSLSGDYTAASNTCQTHRSVTFSRIGDVDMNALPDPAAEPPRVVSPAQALRGRYHMIRTDKSDGGVTLGTEEFDFVVRTDCVRTGERCISSLQNVNIAGGGGDFVFARGEWTYTLAAEAPCRKSGGTTQVRDNATYPLPQPPQDPITLLTGRGRVERSPDTSCISYNYDAKLERTGE